MSEHFDWTFPGLNKHHFIALANLLALRNQGQVEPISLYEESQNGDDSSYDNETSSIDTSQACQISVSGHDKLKREFLDCLAELMANERGGKSVTCSSMRETEEEVTLWIARNEGFRGSDHTFMETLGRLLEGLSNSNGGEQTAEELWKEMLVYYRLRLEKSYIPSLRSSFEHCDDILQRNGITTDHLSAARESLMSLRQVTFNDDRPGIRFTNVKTHSTNRTKKLWGNLYFLGRLRVTFSKFIAISLRLPSFNKVSIVPVPHVTDPDNALRNPTDLRQVFNLLDLPLEPSTIKAVIGKRWTVAKAEKHFEELQNQKINVHAEVRMVLYFSKEGRSVDQIFPYFGCSKYSCFMCWHFLEGLDGIETRGCHGRVFKPWGVPKALGLAPGRADILSMALLRLQENLRKELSLDLIKTTTQVKTSVVGGSNVFSDPFLNPTERQIHIRRIQMEADRTRVAEKFRRLALGDNESTPPKYRQANQLDTHNDDECYTCSRMTSRKCSVCNKDAFCSKSCEEKMPGNHVFTCARRPLTSADYLCRSIIQNEIPEDEDVLNDFGFQNFTSFADKGNLLGLYKGLYVALEVSPEDIHKWQVEGSLVANIKRVFYGIPEAYRGGYFPWFLDHTHIFDKPVSKEEATKRMIASFFDRARLHLDPGDRLKKPNELQPEAKSDCYRFLATICNGSHPHPIEPGWYTFGFCTCLDEMEEAQLGGLYAALLLGDGMFEHTGVSQINGRYKSPGFETATFSEFWQAYQAGKLIPLMDSKGFKQKRLRFPFLEEFLSVPSSGPHLSVWSLKQVIAVDDPAKFPPSLAVGVDYGFRNCQNFEDICVMIEIYKRLLLKASPLDLHKACIAGKLFEFAQKFNKMDEIHRRLLRNFYPLADE